MKNFLLSIATLGLLASCDAKVNVPPSESHTTIVTPSTEKKTETNTTVTPNGSVEKSKTTTVK